MAGKINVYNLGQKGVNVVKSPVHLDDGELTSAQNVQISQIGSGGGIRKRDGLAKLNSAALAGAGRGMINLPLPDRSNYVRRFFMPYDDRAAGANYFWTSPDGTTWTASKAYGVQPFQSGGVGALDGDISYRWCVHRNKYYYPGNDFSASTGPATIHAIDGDTGVDYLVSQIPRNQRAPASTTFGIQDIIPYSSTYLIISTLDDVTTARGRVFLLNVTNGQLTQLGAETDLSSGYPAHVIVYGGRIFIGTRNTSGGSTGFVKWTRIGDPTWTTDLTTVSTRGYCTGLAVFKGLLYSGWECDVGGTGAVYQRAAAGGWTAVSVTDGTASSANYGPFVVSRDGGTLYAYWCSGNGASPIDRIRKTTDGSAWSDEKTLNVANLTDFAVAGVPWVDTNGDIYWSFGSRTKAGNGHVYRLTGGAWTDVFNGASPNVSSAIGALLMPT